MKEIIAHPGLENRSTSIAFGNNPIQFLEQGAVEFGPCYKAIIGVKETIIVNHPEMINQIFKLTGEAFGVSDATKFFSIVAGQGQITTEGEAWLRHSKATRKHFKQATLLKDHGEINQFIANVLEEWNQKTTISINSEIYQICIRFLLFYYFDFTPSSEEITLVMDLIKEFEKSLLSKSRNPLATDRTSWDRTSFIKHNQEFKELLKKIAKLNAPIIQEIQKEENATEKDSEDLVATLLVAGFDGLGSFLINTMGLIYQNKNTIKQLKDSFTATKTDLSGIKTKDSIVWNIMYESMRIHPQSYIVFRKCLKNIEVMGYNFKAGEEILVSIYNGHRYPTVWENGNNFDPSRFEKLDTQFIKSNFFPFGGGKRVCVGNHTSHIFGYLFLKNFFDQEWKATNIDSVSLYPMLTLRFEPPMEFELS